MSTRFENHLPLNSQRALTRSVDAILDDNTKGLPLSDTERGVVRHLMANPQILDDVASARAKQAQREEARQRPPAAPPAPTPPAAPVQLTPEQIRLRLKEQGYI